MLLGQAPGFKAKVLMDYLPWTQEVHREAMARHCHMYPSQEGGLSVWARS